MSKEALKHAKAKEMGISIKDCTLIDTHRENPKANGGDYTPGNYTLSEPVHHMKDHGTYRHREEFFENLKATVDDRKQVMMLRNKISNQLLAFKRRTDYLQENTVQQMEEQEKHLEEELAKRTRAMKKAVVDYAKYDKLAGVALNVNGVGACTIAQCLVYIDLTKARHASSLWSYVGLDKPSHERYTKNVASGGNKTLRAALYTMADSMVKTRGAYRTVYDQTKERLARSEKTTKTRNTKGHLIECAWKDAKPSHRHGAALRAVSKHFLADYWFVGREILGLPNGPCYAEAKLGGSHKTVDPKSRGWEY